LLTEPRMRRPRIKAKRALRPPLRWLKRALRPTLRRLKRALRPALRSLMWPLQGLALALFWSCCAVMSPERAAAFGARLGRSVGPRSHWHRRLRDNLAIALPHASADQVETCAREVWGSFGATLAEYAHFGKIAERAFDRHVEVVLHPRIEAQRNSGRPFVFVTAHLGKWEISAATARHLGLPLTVVYSPQANPLTKWLVQRQRRHLRCRFLTTDDGLRPLLQELHAGRSIGLLVRCARQERRCRAVLRAGDDHHAGAGAARPEVRLSSGPGARGAPAAGAPAGHRL
jgi:lauroyl/myristoyl acyltransferase